jgi:superfamily II DNA or RNA helicase
LQAVGITTTKEKAELRANLCDRVVVASVQTLSRAERLQRFPANHFSTIIVDEAHRTLADSYLRILERFNQAKVLGVTATPDRGDKRSLAKFYEDIAFEISLTDMIRAGWLCPIRVRTVPLEIDISEVGMRAGDYSDEEIATALEPMLHELADAVMEHSGNRKSLIFLFLVRTSYQFADILREHGLAAEAICGESSDRKEILAKFHSGKTQILCNAMLLTEGYDEPSIDCLICLRPTIIRSLFAQMVGRGTRIHPGKNNLLLLDFLWLSRQHDLVKPAALIAKDEDEQAQIEAQLSKADATCSRLNQRPRLNAKPSSSGGSNGNGNVTAVKSICLIWPINGKHRILSIIPLYLPGRGKAFPKSRHRSSSETALISRSSRTVDMHR